VITVLLVMTVRIAMLVVKRNLCLA